VQVQLGEAAQGNATYDALSLQLVLAALANLSYLGLSTELAALPALPPLLSRAVVDAATRPDDRRYALAAAFNFSTEAVVLRALHAGGAAAPLKQLATLLARDQAAGEAARHARHTRAALKAYLARQRTASSPSSPPALQRAASMFGGAGGSTTRSSKSSERRTSRASKLSPRGAGGGQPVEKNSRSRSLPMLTTLRVLLSPR